MKKTHLLILFILLIINTAIAQPATNDATFIIGTGFNDYVRVVRIQPDNKILIGGNFTSYNGSSSNKIVRLNEDGTIDNSFNIGTGFDNTVWDMALQQDDKIIIVGVFTSFNGTAKNKIVRLNNDGSIDASFNVGSGFNSLASDIAIQEDGKIIVAGNFTSYNGTSLNRIIRLNSDGTIDTGFNIGTGYSDQINTIAIQNDGKILIGGNYNFFNSVFLKKITRLNSDGTNDSDFSIGTGFNDFVNDIQIQNDGKIIVCGLFSQYNGTSRNRIVRLNNDGTLDASFVTSGAGFDNTILKLQLQKDGKIITGGWFTTYDGTSRNRIARLNSNGSLDTDFDPGNGFNNNTFTLALQSNNKIIVGGNFSTYTSISTNSIARLNICNTTPTPTITVNQAVLTSSATINNQWYYNGNAIAGATEQTYTVTQNGTYTVRDINDCSSFASEINFTTVGISNIDTEKEMSLFPNPTSGKFKIISESASLLQSVKIYTISGALLYQTNKIENEIDVTNIAQGMVFVHLIYKDKTSVKKLIIRDE